MRQCCDDGHHTLAYNISAGQGGDKLDHIRRRVREEALHGPVEGGARNCARCRFFVTGPAFLGGLIAKFNATAGHIREKLRALKAAEETRSSLAERAAVDPEAARDPVVQKRAMRADEAVQQFGADYVVLRNTWISSRRASWMSCRPLAASTPLRRLNAAVVEARYAAASTADAAGNSPPGHRRAADLALKRAGHHLLLWRLQDDCGHGCRSLSEPDHLRLFPHGSKQIPFSQYK